MKIGIDGQAIGMKKFNTLLLGMLSKLKSGETLDWVQSGDDPQTSTNCTIR